MIKYFCICTFALILITARAENPLQRMPGDKMINDYAGVLNTEEERKLEIKTQQYKVDSSVKVVVVLSKGVIKRKANEYAARLAESWGLGQNTFLIVADIQHVSYGFFVGDNLKETYPKWVLEKIEHNHLRPNFRDGSYFEGLDQTTDIVIGLKSGKLDPVELKKDSSNSISIILILVVLFFFLIFPIWQFRAMKRSHFSSRPIDFVSSVLLMNTFGSRGKNVFDDFSKGKGIFANSVKRQVKKSFAGGGGIAGSW